jgi:hypothetical protein
MAYHFGPGHEHGTATTVAYRVVRTDWTQGMDSVKRELIQRFESTPAWGNYPAALDRVRQVRAEAGPQQYGVIDTEYACGCVSE